MSIAKSCVAMGGDWTTFSSMSERIEFFDPHQGWEKDFVEASSAYETRKQEGCSGSGVAGSASAGGSGWRAQPSASAGVSGSGAVGIADNRDQPETKSKGTAEAARKQESEATEIVPKKNTKLDQQFVEAQSMKTS